MARELITEIMSKDFVDPGGGTALGLNAGEDINDRTTLDDVDDYDNWNKRLPVNVNDQPMDGAGGSVILQYFGNKK